ncbi:MAG: hypothetical protein AAFS07_19190, partial [Pseudomonadota bacterium]
MLQGEARHECSFHAAEPREDPSEQVLLGLPPDPVWPHCFGGNSACFVFSAVGSAPQHVDLRIGLVPRKSRRFIDLYRRRVDLCRVFDLAEVAVQWFKLWVLVLAWQTEVEAIAPTDFLPDCMPVQPKIVPLAWHAPSSGRLHTVEGLVSIKYSVQDDVVSVAKKIVLGRVGAHVVKDASEAQLAEARRIAAASEEREGTESTCSGLVDRTAVVIMIRDHVQSIYGAVAAAAAGAVGSGGAPVHALLGCTVTCEQGYDVQELGSRADGLWPVLRIHHAPLGVPILAQSPLRTCEEVLSAVQDVLGDAARLHDRARLVHRDIRWPNVIRCGAAAGLSEVRYMLIDYFDAVPLDEQGRAAHREFHEDQFATEYVMELVKSGDYGAELDLRCIGHLLLADSTFFFVSSSALEALPGWVHVFGEVLRKLPASARVVEPGGGGTQRVLDKFIQLRGRWKDSAEAWSAAAGRALEAELAAEWGLPAASARSKRRRRVGAVKNQAEDDPASADQGQARKRQKRGG